MKFVSRKPTSREAKTNAQRRVIKFAWRPVNCDDGHTYWLRRIVVEQKAYLKEGGHWKADPKIPTWFVLSKLPLYKLPKAEARLIRVGK